MDELTDSGLTKVIIASLFVCVVVHGAHGSSVFHDRFDDPGGGSVIYSGIDGASPVESGGRLSVTTTSEGQGISISWSEAGVDCTRFESIIFNEIPSPGAGDRVEITWNVNVLPVSPAKPEQDEAITTGGQTYSYDPLCPSGWRYRFFFTKDGHERSVTGCVPVGFASPSQLLSKIDVSYDRSGFLGLGSQVTFHFKNTATGETFDSPKVDPVDFDTVGFDIRLYGQFNEVSIDGIATDSEHIASQIPTFSEWGAVGMTLLLFVAGTIVFFQKREAETGVA